QLEVANHGIDCVIIGSSMTNAAFDGEIFRSALVEVAGLNMVCVNVGIGGLMAPEAGEVARLVAEKYHPTLLIFGTSARDYSEAIYRNALLLYANITQTPWVRYRLYGDWSLDGWLVEASYLYRYLVTARRKLQAYSGAVLPPVGFIVPVTEPPDPEREAIQYDAMSNYTMHPRTLAGLESILALRHQGVQVLVVEVPAHDSYLDFFDDPERDMALYRSTVGALADQYGAPFWL